MQGRRIAFIGGGNMATSLIGGLVNAGAATNDIIVSDPDPCRREALIRRFGVRATDNNAEAAQHGQAIVFAVKPQIIRTVCQDLAAATGHRPLIVSVAAGVLADDIDRWLGGGQSVVRCMPNTPALIGEGITALFANVRVDAKQRTLAETMVAAVGDTIWLDDEEQMNIVTALSGSGPAYFFLFMESLQAAASELGLPSDAAKRLTTKTALGAARLAAQGEDDVITLRAKVTSPGGTTERGVAEFEQGGLRGLVRRALVAARQRSKELAKQIGNE